MQIGQTMYLRKDPPVRLVGVKVVSVHEFRQCVTVRDADGKRIVTRSDLWDTAEALAARTEHDEQKRQKRLAEAKAKRDAVRATRQKRQTT